MKWKMKFTMCCLTVVGLAICLSPGYALAGGGCIRFGKSTIEPGAKLDVEYNDNIYLDDESEKDNATKFLKSLITLARLPQTLTEVHVGDFKTIVNNAPSADINIFGMEENLSFEFIKEMTLCTNSSCLFVKDSGHESILA